MKLTKHQYSLIRTQEEIQEGSIVVRLCAQGFIPYKVLRITNNYALLLDEKGNEEEDTLESLVNTEFESLESLMEFIEFELI